jgi:S-adenosylmethionine hydrolase
MARPVIALLTDFGTRDHYAGTMKGVALGICPDVTLIDITHDVPPHDVLAGTLELAVLKALERTIFLVVVDPKSVGAASIAGRLSMSRDNGVLTLVFKRPSQSGSCSPSAYARPTVSRTFEDATGLRRGAWLAKASTCPALGAR